MVLLHVETQAPNLSRRMRRVRVQD